MRKSDELEICPKCKGTAIIAVEYSHSSVERYDGISEYRCLNKACGYRQGRWTGFELHDGQIEPRYGMIRTLDKHSGRYREVPATEPVNIPVL